MKKVLLTALVFLAVVVPVSADDEWPLWTAVVPVALNISVGFGVGSFVVGDCAGGWGGLAGEAIGLTMGYLGYVAVLGGGGGLTEALIYAGLGLFLGARFVWGILRPLWFVSERNARLRQGNLTFDFSPVLATCSGRHGHYPGIGLSVSVALQ